MAPVPEANRILCQLGSCLKSHYFNRLSLEAFSAAPEGPAHAGRAVGTECAGTGCTAAWGGDSPELGVGASASLHEHIPTSSCCHLASGHGQPPPARVRRGTGPGFPGRAGAVEGALMPAGPGRPVLSDGLQGGQRPDLPGGRP